MKRMIARLLILVCMLVSATCLAETFALNYSPDYYNPFAHSVKFQFLTKTVLTENHYIKITISAKNIVKNQILFTTDFKIQEGVSIFDVYFFIADCYTDHPEVRIRIPKSTEGFSSSIQGPGNITGITEFKKELLFNQNQTVSFMKLLPPPDVYYSRKGIVATGFGGNALAKISPVTALEFFISARIEQNPPKQNKDDTSEAISGEENEQSLIKARDEALKLYRMNKGSFEELNRRQGRLMKYYELQKKSKTLKQ